MDPIIKYLRVNDIKKTIAAVEKNNRKTALHIACKNGHFRLVDFLIRK